MTGALGVGDGHGAGVGTGVGTGVGNGEGNGVGFKFPEIVLLSIVHFFVSFFNEHLNASVW